MRLKTAKILLLAAVAVSVFSLVKTTGAVDISLGTLGTTSTQGVDLGEYVRSLYKFGVGAAGVLAVGMIAAGGIMYTVSGIANVKSEAIDRIKSAIYGLLLLLGATLLLNTINPQIAKLELPSAGENLEPKRECKPEEEPTKENNCVITKASVAKPSNCKEVIAACTEVVVIPEGDDACKEFRRNTLEPSGSKTYKSTSEYCADTAQIVGDYGKLKEGYSVVAECKKLSETEAERVVIALICKKWLENSLPAKKLLFIPAYPRDPKGSPASCVKYGIMELENKEELKKEPELEYKWKYKEIRDVSKNYLPC